MKIALLLVLGILALVAAPLAANADVTIALACSHADS